jgi:4-amino-4-deoxy-L-arabinose transferase-like glycosyltransferase
MMPYSLSRKDGSASCLVIADRPIPLCVSRTTVYNDSLVLIGEAQLTSRNAPVTHNKPTRQPARWAIPAILLLITGITLFLRAWRLNSIPPWLWADEAAQGLNARDLLIGHVQAFFPRGMGQEPFYAYLTAPFVAAWDGQPFAVRLTGALLSALMVPALYVAARALGRDRPYAGVWAGVAAAGFWATNFWPQSMGRIGFQVNTLPLMLTLSVVLWLSYTRRPTRRGALIFGLLAGLTLATYLAARITPVLWVLLYLALPKPVRRCLRSTLPWALLAFCVAGAPLVIHFLRHPMDFIQRASAFDLLQPGTGPALVKELLLTMEQLLGAFMGWAGDPMLRHNIPNRPPIGPVLAVLFAVGLVSSLVAALRRREQSAITLLLWWTVLCVPFLASLSNAPHFPRLFGALPAALLLAAQPGGWGGDRLRRSGRRLPSAVLAGALALLLIVEGARTVQAYFDRWAKDPDLYYEYQGELWTFGEEIAKQPGAIGVAPVDPDLSYSLDYLYPKVAILQLPAGEKDAGQWLADHLPGDEAAGKRVLAPIWRTGANLMTDPRRSLPFYLQREGTLEATKPLRDLDLLSFRLGENPQFAAQGQRADLGETFSPNLTLREVRWGAAYPNGDRSSESSTAGTPFWLFLSWQMARPEPDLRIAIDLVDGAGHRLASSEDYLMDEQQRALSSKQPDLATSAPSTKAFDTYHLITIPSTQPAGPVSLQARVYDARTLEPLLTGDGAGRDSVTLGAASVTPAITPVDGASFSIDQPVQQAFPSGVELMGRDALPEAVAAGQTLTFRLYWRVAGPLAEPAAFTVGLEDTAMSAEIEVPQDTPAGQIIHSYVDIHLPPDAAAGDYRLLLTPSTGTETTPVDLGRVSLTNRQRQFSVPAVTQAEEVVFGDAVRLVGVDEDDEIAVRPGQTITVTLVWQALSTPPRDLVRFVHLLGTDGKPLAQEDKLPCAGECSAPSWLPGEVLIDQARLTIPDGLAAGKYLLAAGWYDAATFERLPVRGAATSEPDEELAILPTEIVVDQ